MPFEKAKYVEYKKGVRIMKDSDNKNNVTAASKAEIEEILRHYSKSGDINFNIIQLSKIKIPNNLSRQHGKKQINTLKKGYKKLGYTNPVMLTDKHVLISGYGRYLAAQELNMDKIPAIILTNITEAEADAIRLADNRIAEESSWDFSVVKFELEKLQAFDFDYKDLGFDTIDYDKILFQTGEKESTHEKDKEDTSWIDKNIPQRVNFGDLYRLGDHFIFCGDSLQEDSFIALMQGEKAQIVITDPPYNCKVKNFVCKTKHEDFKMASGEMNDQEFAVFISAYMENLVNFSDEGSLAYHFMDWRQTNILLTEGYKHYSELLNILVWNKGSGGMGSFYRSQHELIPVFKKAGTYQNHIQLGKHGRYRTNVLDYPGVRASNPESLELLKLHPTVKSVPLIHDLLLDASMKNDIVLDCFGGSGSTLIAAERAKRRARLIEISPRYCDVIIYRWEKETGKKAKLIKNIGEKADEQ